MSKYSYALWKAMKLYGYFILIIFFTRLLSGMKINTEEDAFKVVIFSYEVEEPSKFMTKVNNVLILQAMDVLHKKGANSVVITSSELGEDNTLVAFGSSNGKGSSGEFFSCLYIE